MSTTHDVVPIEQQRVNLERIAQDCGWRGLGHMRATIVKHRQLQAFEEAEQIYLRWRDGR